MLRLTLPKYHSEILSRAIKAPTLSSPPKSGLVPTKIVVMRATNSTQRNASGIPPHTLSESDDGLPTYTLVPPPLPVEKRRRALAKRAESKRGSIICQLWPILYLKMEGRAFQNSGDPSGRPLYYPGEERCGISSELPPKE